MLFLLETTKGQPEAIEEITSLAPPDTYVR